jgi:hypothetical protein
VQSGFNDSSSLMFGKCSQGMGGPWLPPSGAHRRLTKTNLISGETFFSPLPADLPSPPGFSLSAYGPQNLFVLCNLSRLCPLLRFFVAPRPLISCTLLLYERLYNVEDSLAGVR